MSMRHAVGMCCLAGLLAVGGYAAPASDMADAAMNKDKAAVRSLLKQKADVNAPQPDGTTALIWAVRSEDTEMVDMLLTAGANVKLANHDGATAMYQASVNGSATMIERLLKAGAEVNGTFLTTGETALMEASRTGKIEAVKALLDHGAQVNAKETLRQTTPLMWAASQDHPEVVRLLISKGADLNVQSLKEKVTAQFGQLSKVADHLEKGGLTALTLAAREGGTASVKALIEAGADANQTTGDGSTALLVAVQNGHYDIGKYLIEHGGRVSTPNQKGWSPLYMAIKNRNIETGTMPNAPNMDQTLDFIKLLLDHDAEVNGRLAFETEMRNSNHVIWLKEEGATPFFRASYCGDLEVMKLLLAHGADPNIATKDHTTPLMTVAGVGFTPGVVNHRSPEDDLAALKLLLDTGADVNAANDQGLTALMGAAHKGADDQIVFLVDHGAKLDAHDKGKYCGNGGKDCVGGVIALNYAEGVQTTSQSTAYKPETVALLEKLMTERGIPIPKENRTLGGIAAKIK